MKTISENVQVVNQNRIIVVGVYASASPSQAGNFNGSMTSIGDEKTTNASPSKAYASNAVIGEKNHHSSKAALQLRQTLQLNSETPMLSKYGTTTGTTVKDQHSRSRSIMANTSHKKSTGNFARKLSPPFLHQN